MEMHVQYTTLYSTVSIKIKRKPGRIKQER